MRYTFFLLPLLLIIFQACKTETKKIEPKETVDTRTIQEKIASAHGYDHWKKVTEFHFTFNVDRDSSHFERSWIWKPKTNEITAIGSGDTLVYSRKMMDSTAFKTNGGFINDRYWVLAPFNLIWDQNNYEYDHAENQVAPISKTPMQRLTIVYSNKGGYTPGDAYDFYFGDDFILREWVFRKGNQEEPSMTTTWENYTNVNGLELAQDHKKSEGGFNLNFTNLKVLTQ